MDSPTHLPAPGALPARGPSGGPCGPARAEVDSRCADAERLAQAAAVQQQRLREAKRQLAELVRQRDTDARVRDRRQLNEAKEEARKTYREMVARATSPAEVQDAAGAWLRDMDLLNRQLAQAETRAEHVTERAAALQRAMPGMELAADAARISAESAQVACVESRRQLAACEEETSRRVATGGKGGQMPATAMATGGGPGARFAPGTGSVPGVGSAPGAIRPTPYSTGAPPAPANQSVAEPPAAPRVAPIALLLRGDRQSLLGLTLRLADETGVEAGRLQLLLLELRAQIAARALEEHALAFPAGHPFWSQFNAEAGQQLVASLGQLGFGFDGRQGWRDGRSPTIRDLAMALAHCGYDPRVLRRPAGQAAIDELWQGTSVLVEEFLASRAPDLALGRLLDLLGNRASRLGELWDMWGRLRPLLLPRLAG